MSSLLVNSITNSRSKKRRNVVIEMLVAIRHSRTSTSRLTTNQGLLEWFHLLIATELKPTMRTSLRVQMKKALTVANLRNKRKQLSLSQEGGAEEGPERDHLLIPRKK